MSGIVLRGDWLKLRRKGARVWVRERPYEVFWRTTADFTVDDILSIGIQSLRLELDRRRRVAVGRGPTRVVRPAVTRVVIERSAAPPLSIDLNESEGAVVAAFADLGDRIRRPVTIDLVAEHEVDDADDRPSYISWQPVAGSDAPEPARENTRRDDRDPQALVEVAQRHDAELAREVSFKLELGARPEAVERWIRQQTNREGGDPRPLRQSDDLFPGADSSPAPKEGGAWVRKRRKKRMRRRTSGSSG
jgi:hypothetical protein